MWNLKLEQISKYRAGSHIGKMADVKFKLGLIQNNSRRHVC